MSFLLDYDSACDTCTPAAVCVFIFKSFAVLSIKSRTHEENASLCFPFLFWGFVVGTLVLLLFVVFCLFLRQGGMRAVEAGLKLTPWLIMTSAAGIYAPSPSLTENCVFWMTFSVCENFSCTPPWEDEGHHCLFVVVSLPPHSLPSPDLARTCGVYVSFWNSWIWV